MGKWFKVHSVSSAIGRSMVLILFMASLIALVAMVTLFYSVPDAKAINLSGSLRMQAYRMACISTPFFRDRTRERRQ